MIIGITGTPGTGKTSACALLADVGILDLNELIKTGGLHLGIDEERDSLIADMDAVRDRVREIARLGAGSGVGGVRGVRRAGENLTIEGHLAHHISDIAIVLRLSPDELKLRLNARGYSEAKVQENVLAETIDVILVEAVEWCERVYEINTTGMTVEEVAGAIREILDAIGRGIAIDGYMPGSVDWM